MDLCRNWNEWSQKLRRRCLEVLLGGVSVYSVSITLLKFSETTSNQRHVGMINPLRALWAASSHQFLQVREIRAAGPWDHCYDTRKHPGLWPTRYVAGRLWYPDYKMTLPDVNIQIMIIISSRFIEWWYKSIRYIIITDDVLMMCWFVIKVGMFWWCSETILCYKLRLSVWPC